MTNFKEMHSEYRKAAKDLEATRDAYSGKVAKYIEDNLDLPSTSLKLEKHEILITPHFHYDRLVISLHSMLPKNECREWTAIINEIEYHISSSFVDIEDIRAIDAVFMKG
jgi:DNA repair ATPase RecN